VQIAGADPVWSNLPSGRVFSSIGQPNWLAAYLVLTIPLTVALTITVKSRALRLLGAGASLLQIVVLAATLSRSGYAGIVAALVVGVSLAVTRRLRSSTSSRQILVGTVAVVVVGAALLVGLSRATSAVAPWEIASRAVSSLDVGGFDSGRYLALWGVGLAIAGDHPLTGTGQDTYATVFSDYRDDVLDETYAEHFARFRPEGPHNAYISIAAGSGFPTLAAYVIMVGGIVAAILPHIRVGGQTSILLAGLMAALVGHVFTDWFITMDLSGSLLFWTLMGAGLAFVERPSLQRSE
jgi:O-antigen ligase